jgi:hypothetical protein
MAITIVNRSFSHAGLSAIPFNIAPTTAGNSLVIAVSVVCAGSVFASITTNAGDAVSGLSFSSALDASINISGLQLTTGIFWIPSCVGSATTMTITVSCSFNAWVYELSSDAAPITPDAISFTDSDAPGPAGTVATGPTLLGTGIQDFYVSCLTVGQVIDVSSPWTLDETDIGEGTSYGFGAAYLLSSGAQTPVFNQTFNGRWSVSAVAFTDAGSGPAPPCTPSVSYSAFNFNYVKSMATRRTS